MPNTGTINSQNKIAPCQMNVSKGGGDSTAKWINQTNGALTLRCDTIGNYFNDSSGNPAVSPLTIAVGNPATGGGLTLTLKSGVTPPYTLNYTIDNVSCPQGPVATGSDPSIQIEP